MSERTVPWFCLAVLTVVVLWVVLIFHFTSLTFEQWVIKQYSECIYKQDVVHNITRPWNDLKAVCQPLEPIPILKEVTNND